ncbi:hypothetical protein N657DRAFT_675180 [Parathielavia appendiculata]|uniref:Uncharacterized protein n=1 Tax=Parathielavia appendiculata TaxID=2587402 RepID=A0AAN6TRT6_9PEZI|nr:hypothetical protein N657DRAFT_675180 [Parathielavia appendiculata]
MSGSARYTSSQPNAFVLGSLSETDTRISRSQVEELAALMQDCAGVRSVPTLIASVRRGLAIRLRAISAPQLVVNLETGACTRASPAPASRGSVAVVELPLHHEQQDRLGQAVRVTGTSNSMLISLVRLTTVGVDTRSTSTLGD